MATLRTTLCALLAAALSACSAASSFTRPEGGGGWSEERKSDEIAGLRADRFPDDGAAGAARVWDLPSALEHARRYNRRVAEADEQLAVERQRVFEARGRLLPATTGSGRYTWYSDAQTIARTFPLLPGGGAFAPLEIREDEAGTLNGTIMLPIDLSGELRHTLAAAQAGYRGEAARRWATRLAEDVQVIRAYFRRLAAERLHEVTEQTRELRAAQLRLADSRFQNGRLTKNQLLVVQVAVRNADQELVQRQVELDRARWAFNQVLGLDIDAASDVTDVRDRPDVPPIEDMVAAARAKNPLLAAIFEEQQRLEETATALARSRFPRFHAGGSIDYTTSDVLEPQEMGAGFVGFNWDLGTDTRREADIAAARHAAERNRIRTERQSREIEEAVRGAHRALAERLSALDSAAAAVGQAEENLRIRGQQFDAGRATSEDVLDAQSLLAAERATLASALYEAMTRRAELQQLVGEAIDVLVAAGR